MLHAHAYYKDQGQAVALLHFAFAADRSLSEFTGLISTSNHIVGDTVMVETDANVIWITETAM